MNKRRSIAVAVFVVFAAVLSLRLCQTPAPPPKRDRPDPPIPEARIHKVDPPAPRKIEPAPPQTPDPARLRAFLESLGRARVLRDQRSLDRLRREMPPLYESDFVWIAVQLETGLFPAAGAAELLRLFRRRDAVHTLDAVLSRPDAHAFLKDLLIDALRDIQGDAAEAALLKALRDDADDSIRLRAAAALADFPAPETLRCLIDALRDPSPRVRSSAAAALARLNGSGAVDALLRALGQEQDPAAQADLVVAAWTAGDEAARDAVRRVVQDRPLAAELLRARVRIHDLSRYGRSYDRVFFEPGGLPVPRDPSKPRIGITLEAGSSISPREVARMLFDAAPLDRYRDWFYIRRAEDFPATGAFDASGDAIVDVPYGDLEGTVFIHFKDPSTFAQGVLGYSKGCHAYVQGMSLLHEFGHAFARLGDEYADGSQAAAANLYGQPAVPWMPLVSQGLLAAPIHRDAKLFIPTDNCYLSNSPIQTRYCPVCQLEIHARMAELSGAPLPW